MDQASQIHAIYLGCLQSWDTNLHPIKIKMVEMISPVITMLYSQVILSILGYSREEFGKGY